MAEPIEMPFGFRSGDVGGPKEPCIRWRSRSPLGRGNFKGEGFHCKV